ncbi:organelle RRM domain-containing protein 2, mitochondrial-like [Cornus florida]|uniref:organelle RRM domain-containing protein 2, mitochondrial-like n=1 Tax=Cornus florida TaxID=4283 RepID=UPI00289DD0CF|nr:organelle RRM domain-containing protein 2, mitochondrial-like [Cornus florida]
MAMRAAVAAAAKPRGLRGFFSTLTSTSPFIPPPMTQMEKPPPADPSTNLFVSGLSKRTTQEGLKKAFSKFGEVVHARVVTDRISGYSKGFGFVRYTTLEEATAGMKGMDGKYLDGWVIFAEYARVRPPPGQGPPSENNGSPHASPYNRQY